MALVEEQSSVKKRRRGGARVRVTRACDFCKRKKLKCTGTQPCALCTHAKRDCTYVSEYNRGKVRDVSTTSTDRANPEPNNDAFSVLPGSESNPQPQTGFCSSITKSTTTLDCGRDCSPNQTYQHQPECSSPQSGLSNGINNISTVPEVVFSNNRIQPLAQDSERSSRNSPEPAHTDQEGHYVGPASGVSFLARALKKLRQAGHSATRALHTSIFNFADSPVPHYDPYFLILPSQADAQTLIRIYFDFASPTHRYLHQPTVDRWCVEFYESIRKPGPIPPGGHEIRAILLGILAVAKQYSSSQDININETVNSAAFFAASEHHLHLESGGIRLTGIQARLIQCFHLLSQSRVNSAWSLFGTVANLVLAIGLHRRHKRDANFEIDRIERECRKRVFWSAYTLDSYLGVGLGRPRSFHEEDIDQELPLCVDDWQITPTNILSRSGTEQSLTKASIYHAKLLKIIGGILRDLYGLRRLSPEKQEHVTQSYDKNLTQWRNELEDFLGIVNTEMLRPLFQRQHTVLELAHSQAIILLHRHALLTKSPLCVVRQDNTGHASTQYSVRRCLDAATTIVKRLRGLVEKKQMYSAYWFTHYYVFSALVALYLYVIQSRSRPVYMWKHYLDLAQQGLRDLASCSTDMTYAQRYVVVLTELQEEAMTLVGERGSTLPINDGQASPKHSNIRPEHTPIMDVDVPSITTATSDGDLVSQQLHGLVSELEGPQSAKEPESLIANDTYIYPGAGEPWDLQGMANQEAFRDLNIEGLADLAFIFSGEPTNLIQAEELGT